jgi:hypothetical protein
VFSHPTPKECYRRQSIYIRRSSKEKRAIPSVQHFEGPKANDEVGRSTERDAIGPLLETCVVKPNYPMTRSSILGHNEDLPLHVQNGKALPIPR